jgi:hypothetical protein
MSVDLEKAAPQLHVDRRRRRPTGAPPPLPRHIGFTGKIWLGLLGAMLLWSLLALRSDQVFRNTERTDSVVLRAVARLRTGWLTSAARFLDDLGSGYAITVLAIGLIVALLIFRRWRHLFTFLGAIAIIEIVGGALYDAFSRPRPFGVTTVGSWAGYSMPAMPVAVLAAVLLGITYTMVPAGRSRDAAKLITIIVIGLFVAARIYLGVDRPSDVFMGITLSVAVTVSMFRTLIPNEVFPVSYRRAKTAHLDVGGRRGEAIRQAIHDQLGLTVIEIKPVGLEGSGGSTPLRLCVAGNPNTYVFGKLYAMSHVRADRWYKLGRTILYGRLEDEAPFQTVRRLVEYEDYAARVLRDAGIPTAEPHGIVEITPEREYLLVTEFLDGAKEIGVSPFDDDAHAEQVIDAGLMIVRQLWDAGLAHRDIKPANLLVRGTSAVSSTRSSVQVRPSPWRPGGRPREHDCWCSRCDRPRSRLPRAAAPVTPDEIAEAVRCHSWRRKPDSASRAVMKSDGGGPALASATSRPIATPVALAAVERAPRRPRAAVLVCGCSRSAQVAALVEPARDVPRRRQPEVRGRAT